MATIREWLSQQGWQGAVVEPLTGDVSLRRYFRVRSGERPSAVLAWYPPDLRPVCHRFVATSVLLGGAGVAVPEILATSCRGGLMLLEDAGEQTLYELAGSDWDQLSPIYRRAADLLPRIQRISAEVVAELSPPLGPSLLRWELEKTWELFLEPAGLTGGARSAGAVREALHTLCERLGSEPPVPCHRDFMPRNLMLRGGRGGDLLVLDHQDLRLGPPGYDLASLLNDSLFPPAALEAELVSHLMPGVDGLLSFRRAVVQRTLKAIGNYCDFARRGFDRHLGLVAPSLARAWRHLGLLPETRHLVSHLRASWMTYLEGAGLADNHLLD
jgi:aminoglycoside/choline kinase family phosphotransferase